MGTSSSRSGKVTKNPQNNDNLVSWLSAKNSATRYYKGNGSFGVAFQKVILASGGRERFANTKREKKIKGLHTLLTFFELAKTVGIKNALSKNGIQIDDEKTTSELIIEYVNSVVYPNAISYSDTSNREELARLALAYYSLFDSHAMVNEEEQAILNAISDIVCDGIATEIMDSFEEEVPLSLENEDVKTTLNRIDAAKKNIKSKVQKYSKIYTLRSSLSRDIEEYEHCIYNAVINDYIVGDFGDE